jgi:hypothetical protein
MKRTAETTYKLRSNPGKQKILYRSVDRNSEQFENLATLRTIVRIQAVVVGGTKAHDGLSCLVIDY